jgi:Mpv17 / PMP22 family
MMKTCRPNFFVKHHTILRNGRLQRNHIVPLFVCQSLHPTSLWDNHCTSIRLFVSSTFGKRRHYHSIHNNNDNNNIKMKRHMDTTTTTTHRFVNNRIIRRKLVTSFNNNSNILRHIHLYHKHYNYNYNQNRNYKRNRYHEHTYKKHEKYFHNNNNKNNNNSSKTKTTNRWWNRIGLFVSWYSYHLDHYPIITKSITSGFISSTGDIICQMLQQQQQQQKQQQQEQQQEQEQQRQLVCEVVEDSYHDEITKQLSCSETSKITKNSISNRFDSWDITRTVRFMILGTFLVGPVCHYWYNILAHILVPSTSSLVPAVPFRIVFYRVLYDQLIFAPCFIIIWTSCFHFVQQVMMIGMSCDLSSFGHSFTTLCTLSYHQTYQQLSSNFYEILIVNWLLWIPCQFLNFKLIPIKYQVLVSNLVALTWNVYLSHTTSTSLSKSAESI